MGLDGTHWLKQSATVIVKQVSYYSPFVCFLHVSQRNNLKFMLLSSFAAIAEIETTE